jgi:hypothetical protein
MGDIPAHKGKTWVACRGCDLKGQGDHRPSCRIGKRPPIARPAGPAIDAGFRCIYEDTCANPDCEAFERCVHQIEVRIELPAGVLEARQLSKQLMERAAREMRG